jgi:hypothetical protein
MTNSILISIIACSLCFSACYNKTNTTTDNKINFRDTIHNRSIWTVTNDGDTMWQHDNIYFVPTDQTLDTSSFSFNACERPCSYLYKVYFQKNKVISYCDSMSAVLSKYKRQGDLDIFYARYYYEHLKEQAQNNTMKDLNNNEIAVLLDGVRPLIINPTTGYRPQYYMVNHKLIKHGNMITSNSKTYDFKGKEGDTVNLTVTIGEVDLLNY